MGAMVEARQRVPAQRVIPLEIDAVAAEKIDQVLRHRRGADGVEDHFDRHTCARALGKRFGELASDVTIPVNVELEIDRPLRGANRGEHRREDLYAVAQNLDAISM